MKAVHTGVLYKISQMPIKNTVFHVPFQFTTSDGGLYTNASRASISKYPQGMLVMVVDDQTEEKTVNCKVACMSD